MLIFLWAYVMISALPNGHAFIQQQSRMIEESMRATTEAVQPTPGVAIGAAAGFAR
ncbi:MAG: hypothetical protein ABW199_06220 [Caulobacterales bacterium]